MTLWWLMSFKWVSMVVLEVVLLGVLEEGLEEVLGVAEAVVVVVEVVVCNDRRGSQLLLT